MDTLTHLLVGHAMGTLARNTDPAVGDACYWAALIGNSLPDIDVPISLLWRRDVKLHRTLTHTLPGICALSLILALGLRLFFPAASLLLLWQWALLGNLTHLTLDCLNLFGARLFWPFISRPVSIGVLHILDPFLLLLLGLPALVSLLRPAMYSLLIPAFVLIWPYIVYRLTTAHRLWRRLRREGSMRVRVIPWFTQWRYVLETATAIEFGCLRRGVRCALRTFRKEDSPLVRASMNHPAVIAFLQGAEYPYASIQHDEEGRAVVWGDALRQLRADFRPLRVRM